MPGHSFSRGWTNNPDFNVFKASGIIAESVHPLEEHLHPINTGKYYPVIAVKILDGFINLLPARRSLDFDEWHLNGHSPVLHKYTTQLSCLMRRSGDQDLLTKEWPFLKPA